MKAERTIMNRRPAWINKKIDFRSMHDTEERLTGLGLHTVCHQARCPNISECYSRGTATFLMLGGACTRSCSFCNVGHGPAASADPDEPDRIVEAVGRMGLRHAVITSVTRDDLPDGGASVFAAVTRKLKGRDPALTVELLTPDFRGDRASIRTVVEAGPDIFGHNVETAPSLYDMRPGCDYRRSLGLLAAVKEIDPRMLTKTALLLGMGETRDEIIEVFRDLRGAGCDFLSIGQYLRPGKGSLPVREYVAPEAFEEYGRIAAKMGFRHVESGVYVRSSYLADLYTGGEDARL